MFFVMLRKYFSGKNAKSSGAINRAIVPVIERMEGRTLFSFTAPIVAGLGSTANQVLVGDVNGDGKADIVELNSASATITTLLGNGDGTFQAGVSSPSGGPGTRMVMKDFNHDGKLDIVTCQGYSLDMLQGNGDGTFRLSGTYYVGAYANDIDAGDVNHDGFDDICTASSSYGGTTQLLLNDGHGGFLPTRNLAIGPTGYHIRMADVNGDGNVDLVEQGFSTEDVLLGAGDGTFRTTPYVGLGILPTDVQVGDVNHDGMADLVVTDGRNVSLYLGNATGAYSNPTIIPVAGASAVQLGDVNNDGNPDVVTNNGLVMLGRGDGGFYGTQAYGSASGRSSTLADVNGDGVLDDVVASSAAGGGVNVSLNANNDKQALGVTTQFGVSAPDTVGAGVPFAITVTALDANGAVDPTFLGSVSVVGAAGTNPVYYAFTAADQGVATIGNAAEFFTAGAANYSVSSPFLPAATGTVNVVGVVASKFTVVSQAATEAGQPSTVTVAPLDAFGNPAANFLGTVHFSSSDVQAGLPADYTFIADDNGSHTFDVTLKTVGAQTVTVNDAFNPTVKGVSNATAVTPTAGASLNLSGGGGFIGSANVVRIAALDPYGNVATSYNGTVHLASSDPNSTASADAALVNGVGTFTLTATTMGSQTLTANDVNTPSISGTETVNVTPGWGVRFTMTPLAGTMAAGQTQTTTLTIYDAFGDVSTVFNGYVTIRSSDPRGAFSYVYVSPADAGVKTIPVTLYTAGTQSVTISDYVNPGTTITQPNITVTPLSASSISVTPLVGGVAGTAQNVTVTAHDMYGNVATGYSGTVSFATSDTLASLPANYTFTAADAGTHTFPVTLKSSGGQTFNVQDLANPLTMNFAQKDIAIGAAAMSGFTFSAGSLSNSTAGASQPVTLTATDAFGNVITGYTGTVNLTSTDAQASLPASYTFTPFDAGSHAFSYSLKTAGTQSVNATDASNASFTGSTGAIAVKAAALSKLLVSAASAATAGAAQSVTVTASDAYGNAISNYSGTVHFGSSDAAAGLPANYTFTKADNGVHTFNVTFRTPGTQSVSVADALNTAVTGTQGGIVVSAPVVNASSLAISGLTTTTAGAARSFVVSARDASGNVVTNYLGTVTFSSSDQKAGLPASYTFTAADAGAHTFGITLVTAGTQSISASDATAGISGTQSGIAVAAGAAVKLVFSAPVSVTQGVGFKVSVTALDAYGNIATGYRGKVQLTSTDAKGGTTSSSFSSTDNGVHVFSYTFNTLGSQTLKAVDTANSTILGSAIISVLAK